MTDFLAVIGVLTLARLFIWMICIIVHDCRMKPTPFLLPMRPPW